MTIDGPNTPPEPPELIVSDVVRILPNAIASNTPIDAEVTPSDGSNAPWIAPYPAERTASTRSSRPKA